jgi:hypothetical protein
MARRILAAIAGQWRELVAHRAAKRFRGGPVDHADLKRLMELAQDSDEPHGFGRLR